MGKELERFAWAGTSPPPESENGTSPCGAPMNAE